ncbi:putative zinc finger protein rsv2 [Elsinoe fawcettii]|nr:putative zinc finger protein rsv2 [Elsinoe fawcettii]
MTSVTEHQTLIDFLPSIEGPGQSLRNLSDLDPNADLYSSLLSTSGINPKTHAWMNGQEHQEQYPSIRIQKPNNPYSQPLYQDQSLYQQHSTYYQDWQQYQSPQDQFGNQRYTFQGSSSSSHRHSRQQSDSSIASTSPGTPYTQHTPFTFVANSDRSPSTANYTSDTSSDWSKGKFVDYSSQTLAPSQLLHSAAYSAMKDMAMDHHSSGGGLEDVPELFSSRHSNSSHGHNTPNTPRNGEETEERSQKMPGNGNNKPTPFASNGYSRLANTEYHQRGPVELYRTESAAEQDVLFSAGSFDAPTSSRPAPTSTSKNLLTPHGNLVNDFVGKANQNRSQSPQTAREKSPFQQGSEHYPRSPAAVMPSAASIRQKQKEEADQKEYAAHQPPLRREATQTMSPKDALKDGVDYDEGNSVSLFNDILPEGYEKHLGGTETYQNNFISGTNQAFGQFVPLNASNVGGFRGVDLNNFLHSPMENTMADATSYMPAQPFASQRSDKTPEFPAQLTSMESSASENPTASQESNAAPVQRPISTSADSGTYTCTYHGCTQRFDSPARLQKHKREAHQSVSNHTSASPSSASPEAEGSGMTSAMLNRNTQAGPHKCSRINPTTGKPCNTIFSRPYDLTRHEDTIHNKGKQKVRCQHCREEKTFSRNDALTRHMRVVHPDIDFQGKRGRRDF